VNAAAELVEESAVVERSGLKSVVPCLIPAAKSGSDVPSPAQGPHRQMTDEHRRKLSNSLRQVWAARGGFSKEHRLNISKTAKKLWAAKGPMPDAQRKKISASNKATWARKRALTNV